MSILRGIEVKKTANNFYACPLVGMGGAKEKFLSPVKNNLHRIHRPTLIIWGDRDRVFPIRHAYYGKEKISRSRLYIIKQCGHVLIFIELFVFLLTELI